MVRIASDSTNQCKHLEAKLLASQRCLEELSADYDNYKAEQDHTNTTLMTKFCLLLNTKKNEIDRLEKVLEASKNLGSSSATRGVEPKIVRKKRKQASTDTSDCDSKESEYSKQTPECKPRVKKITKGMI